MRSCFIDDLGATSRDSDQKDRDFFRFPNGARAVIFYVDQDKALARDQAEAGAWLELNVTHVCSSLQSLEQVGIRPFAYPIDTSHLYIQAPNGQVFRLVEAQPPKTNSP